VYLSRVLAFKGRQWANVLASAVAGQGPRERNKLHTRLSVVTVAAAKA
jgi:hypothetical protein